MEYRILGPLEVRAGGSAIEIGGGKQRALLALLLTRANDPVSIDLLLEELWGESPPPTARTALQGYVSGLRKALEPERRGGSYELLRTAAPGYVIQVGDEELDSLRFAGLADSARPLLGSDPVRAASLLREALALWRGQPLAEFTYEPFAQGEIARLEEARLVAVEDLNEAELALGRHGDLVGELEALIAKHPLRERLRGQLMLALYRSGRQAEALQAYQATREILVEELGIDPSPPLQRLEKAILTQDASLDAPIAPVPVLPLPPPPRPQPAAPPPPPGQREVRKVVTVVFADLVGSTALAEQLDPEVVRAIQSEYFDAAAAAVERHSGLTEKFAGDAVLAVFGVPVVNEDDALRALRAALDIREAVATMSDDLSAQGIRLEVRVGVNTGEVVSGAESGQHALVTGDAVNVAARLEQAAAPGEILLGAETVRLAGSAARTSELEPLQLKGKAAPVKAWRLVEVIAGADPIARRLDSPFVGRSTELEQLRQAAARVGRDRSSHLFTVLGGAGIGKSRLAAEFLEGIGSEARVVRGRCLPYGQGIALWPLYEIAHELVGEDLAGGLAQLLVPQVDGERAAGVLAAALGAAEGAPSAEETHWAARKLLETAAEDTLLVVLVDDLQWAEAAFLDLLEHVVDWSRDVSILLLCLARPELFDVRPTWGGGKLNATATLLEPLSEDASDALVDYLSADIELDSRARARILEAADGNPLFVEQMLAMLADRPVDGPVDVPPTIQALLAARLDRLGPGERALLEAAAVVGQEFWVGAVRALLPEDARELVERTIGLLVRKELVRQNRSTMPGEESYRFRHLLVRDAAYRGIPKSVRADLHQRFVSWLEEQVGANATEYAEIMGYHLEQAYRSRAELGRLREDDRELAHRAAGLLSHAGLRAHSRGDVGSVVGLLTRAVDLLPAGPERVELLLPLSDALQSVGDLPRAGAVLEEARAFSAAAHDERLSAHARLDELYLETLVNPQADLGELRSVAEGAIPLFEKAHDESGLAKAWRALAEIHLTACRWGESADALEHALEHARRAGEEREVSLALNHLANALFWGPTPAAAGIGRCEQILDRPQGHLTVEANVLGFVGGFRAMLGEAEEARRLISQGGAIFEELGHSSGLAAHALVAGYAELILGDAGRAEAAFRRGYELLTVMGETGVLSSLSAFRAEAAHLLDDHGEALRLTEESERFAAADDIAAQVGWRSARSKVLAARGESEVASALAIEATELAGETDFLNMQGDTFAALGTVLGLAGRAAEASAAFRRAAELYDAKGNVAASARLTAASTSLG